jgi:hypothetical protein
MFDQRLVDEIILFRRFARLWIKDLFFNLRMNLQSQADLLSQIGLTVIMRLIPLSQVAQYVGRGCRAAVVCGGRERALSGRERSASGQSRASQKAVELPPACGQAAQGTLKTGNPAPFQISPATSIC